MSKRSRILARSLAASLAFLWLGGFQAWSGEFYGHYRERMVKGNTSSPYHEFYEWHAFLSPIGNSTNQYCRTGACQGTQTHDGAYIYPSVADGPATIYVDQPEFFAAPKVKQVAISGWTYEDVAPNTDYHMAFGTNMGSWEGPDDPWEWYSGTWYQTFVATGTAINRVDFKLAAEAATVTVAIHESNGGNVSTWPQIGNARQVGAGCTGCDLWIGWPYGGIPTIPGRTYAVSFRNSGGNMGFFVHRDALGPGYPSGTAYQDDVARTYDLYAIVYSNNDGTVVTYQMENSNIGPSDEWAGAWSQSFTARGSSLAAVGLFGENPNQDLWKADVMVFDGISGGHQGNQVGPTKRIGVAGWQGPGLALWGMSYNPGEVPLTPGRQYLVVFSPWDAVGSGLNPRRRPGGNVYPGGTAYIGRGGTWEDKGFDLSMTILEYAAEQQATPTPVPTATPTPAAQGATMQVW